MFNLGSAQLEPSFRFSWNSHSKIRDESYETCFTLEIMYEHLPTKHAECPYESPEAISPRYIFIYIPYIYIYNHIFMLALNQPNYISYIASCQGKPNSIAFAVRLVVLIYIENSEISPLNDMKMLQKIQNLPKTTKGL